MERVVKRPCVCVATVLAALALTSTAFLPGCAARSKPRVEDLWVAGATPEERTRAFDAAVAFVDQIDDLSAPPDASTRARAFSIVHERLRDPNVQTRRLAARTLVGAGYEAKEDSVQALFGAATDDDPWVRAYVAAGIGFAIQRRLATPAMAAGQPERVRDAVALIARSLSDPDAALRVRAAELAQCLGSAAAPTGEQLVKLFDDPDFRVASAALAAVASVGWAPRVPTERLLAMFAHPRHEMRAAVAEVVYKQGAPAVPRMIEALKSDPDDHVRAEVAAVLGDMGAIAAPALPALRLAAANDSSYWVRRSAQIALAKLEGAPWPGE